MDTLTKRRALQLLEIASELQREGILGARGVEACLRRVRARLPKTLKVVHHKHRSWRIVDEDAPIYVLEVREGDNWKIKQRSEIKRLLGPGYHEAKTQGKSARIREETCKQ